MVGRHEGRQVTVVHAVLGEPHRRVGALVGAADERLALVHAAVGRAVDLDVVVRRVPGAVRQPPGDQPEELVLELVGDRVADQRDVRLVAVEHVLDQRPVAGLPVQALLDVRLLADDARLEDGEVAGLRGREALGDEVLEGAGEPGLARPRRPRGVRARDRRVEQPHLREVGGEPLDLDQHGAGLAVQRAALDRDLDVGPLALAQVADRVVAVLGGREQDAVVAGPAVVAAVVDVGVEAVLVDAEVEHAQAHLLRRAVRARDVRPTGGRRRCGLRERRAGPQSRPGGRTGGRTTATKLARSVSAM